MPVGSKPDGASPYGAVDMAGNVSEWVEDDVHSSYTNAPSDGSAWINEPRSGSRTRRGGDKYADASELVATRRSGAYTGYTGKTGFRCCRSP